jgi:hypothetical protein
MPDMESILFWTMKGKLDSSLFVSFAQQLYRIKSKMQG